MNKIKYEKMIDEKIATLKEELMQNFEEECKDEFPQEEDEYWYLSHIGEACRDVWDDFAADRMRLESNNVFRTKEEAEFEVERRKVIAELKKYAEPKNRTWNGINNHYYFVYDVQSDIITINHVWRFKVPTLYFESVEKAREAIDTVGEDRIKKYYLGVDN